MDHVSLFQKVFLEASYALYHTSRLHREKRSCSFVYTVLILFVKVFSSKKVGMILSVLRQRNKKHPEQRQRQMTCMLDAMK